MSGSGGQDFLSVVPLTPSSLLELNETVLCTNDQMEVVIPSAFFLNKLPPIYVSSVSTRINISLYYSLPTINSP